MESIKLYCIVLYCIESSDSCKMEVVAIVRTDADHTGVEQLKNKTRKKINMALPLPFYALDSKATFQ